MRRSQKVEHAFRAMLELALCENSEATAVGTISERTGVPEKFLELILAELRRAGLVQSKRGPVGGYRLARPAELIHLGEIWEAIEGPLARAASGRHAARASASEECLQTLWHELESEMRSAMDRLSLAELRRRRLERRGADDYCI